MQALVLLSGVRPLWACGQCFLRQDSAPWSAPGIVQVPVAVLSRSPRCWALGPPARWRAAVGRCWGALPAFLRGSWD